MRLEAGFRENWSSSKGTLTWRLSKQGYVVVFDYGSLTYPWQHRHPFVGGGVRLQDLGKKKNVFDMGMQCLAPRRMGASA
jgi:hypothetical protein